MAVTGLAPVCCWTALRQSCLVVSLVVSLGIHIVGGAARSLDRTTSHTWKLKSFQPGPRIRSPVPGERKSRKAKARGPQIPSLRSLLVKPEDSDPESEIQEEKESVRRSSGEAYPFIICLRVGVAMIECMVNSRPPRGTSEGWSVLKVRAVWERRPELPKGWPISSPLRCSYISPTGASPVTAVTTVDCRRGSGN